MALSNPQLVCVLIPLVGQRGQQKLTGSHFLHFPILPSVLGSKRVRGDREVHADQMKGVGLPLPCWTLSWIPIGCHPSTLCTWFFSRAASVEM